MFYLFLNMHEASVIVETDASWCSLQFFTLEPFISWEVYFRQEELQVYIWNPSKNYLSSAELWLAGNKVKHVAILMWAIPALIPRSSASFMLSVCFSTEFALVTFPFIKFFYPIVESHKNDNGFKYRKYSLMTWKLLNKGVPHYLFVAYMLNNAA